MTKRNSRQRWLLVFILTVFAGLAGLPLRSALGYSTGPPAAHSGAPGETSCIACHYSYALNSGSGGLTLSGLPLAYQPGQSIDMTLTLSQAGQRRFGLQLTAVDDAGRQAGELIVTSPLRTQLLPGVIEGQSRLYLEHTQTGSLPNQIGQNVWQCKWIAPRSGTGRVTFYLAGNAANGNYTTTGDYIYTRVFTSYPVTTTASLASLSAASFTAAPLAAESIVAAFGTNLAASTQTAATSPLPVGLGGTRVLVRDREGAERLAPLFFVSPNQINYLVPAGTAAGEAEIVVLRDSQAVATGRLTIERLAPSLFSANANGSGWAAAVALRLKPNGAQQFEPVTQFDASQNRFVAAPLDLGAAEDQLFLLAFGTGFRAHQGLSQVKAKLASQDVDVTFAGAQGQLTGLDQLNLRLPRSLAGRGELELELEVEGKQANKVRIWVK